MAVQALRVRDIVGEPELRRAVEFEAVCSERLLVNFDAAVAGSAELRRRRSIAPRPGVTKPEGRKKVKHRRLGAAVCGSDADQHVIEIRFGVLDQNVEVKGLI